MFCSVLHDQSSQHTVLWYTMAFSKHNEQHFMLNIQFSKYHIFKCFNSCGCAEQNVYIKIYNFLKYNLKLYVSYLKRKFTFIIFILIYYCQYIRYKEAISGTEPAGHPLYINIGTKYYLAGHTAVKVECPSKWVYIFERRQEKINLCLWVFQRRLPGQERKGNPHRSHTDSYENLMPTY